MREAEALLLEDMPIIPIHIYTSKSLVNPAVKGLEPNILDYTLYKNLSLDNLSLDKKSAAELPD